MSSLTKVDANPNDTYSIEKTQISTSYILSSMPPVFSNIEGQAFIIEKSDIKDSQVYDKSNLIEMVAEYIFDIDLESIPSELKLCQLALDLMDEEEASNSDELCIIISTWNSVDALRKITKSPALELKLVGSHKIRDQRAVQLFSILEQDYRRPRLRRFTIFVCKLHRDVRL